MKKSGIILIFLFLFIAVKSQTVDTTIKKLPVEHFQEILKGTYTDTLSTHIWIFGNTDCHRCEELHTLFLERNLPWIEYDMHDPNNINLAYDLVKNAEKSEKLSFSFPIVVVNTKLYYNVADLKVLADQIKANFKP